MGRRFVETAVASSPLPKQFQLLGDLPVFVHGLRALNSLGCIRNFILVVPEQYVGKAQEQVEAYLTETEKKQVRVIVGGERRQDSSRLGLEDIESRENPPARVLIHDACRPFLSRPQLERIRTAINDRSYGAWVPVVPVIETLKKIENNQVLQTVDRSTVHRVQTPQIFEFSVIRSLMQKTREMSEHNFTDDASLCEYYGIPVGVFEGDVRNIKLTFDFELPALSSMVSEEKNSLCASDSDTTSIV